MESANNEISDESPDDWLARNIYRHLRKMVSQDCWQILERIAEDRRSLVAGLHSIRERPFKVGLIAFLGDEIAFRRNRRMELSDAMEYAYIHRVPPKYFNGFVKQSCRKRIAAKLTDNYVEPGFKAKQMRARP